VAGLELMRRKSLRNYLISGKREIFSIISSQMRTKKKN
jgi:hypothetical protein